MEKFKVKYVRSGYYPYGETVSANEYKKRGLFMGCDKIVETKNNNAYLLIFGTHTVSGAVSATTHIFQILNYSGQKIDELDDHHMVNEHRFGLKGVDEIVFGTAAEISALLY